MAFEISGNAKAEATISYILLKSCILRSSQKTLGKPVGLEIYGRFAASTLSDYFIDEKKNS